MSFISQAGTSLAKNAPAPTPSVIPASGFTQLLASAYNVAKINGTAALCSWTAPSDGQQHRVTISVRINVTSNETGGQVAAALNGTNGPSLDAGGRTVGQWCTYGASVLMTPVTRAGTADAEGSVVLR